MGGFDITALWRLFVAFFKRPPKAEIEAIKEADHSYIRLHESLCSPCPFLNSLANHGYLPRDGKSMTQSHLKAALLVSANSSPLLADVLSSIVKPVLRPDGTFTLVDLRQHNAIEHDRSFTRLDFRQGDNYTFQPAMFDAFLAAPKVVGAKPLGLRLWLTTWSQTCILLQIFGKEISIQNISLLYKEEKLPEWWMERPGRPTFLGLLGDVVNVFWKHLFVGVPDATLKNPLRGW